jgi:hypothetical protein
MGTGYTRNDTVNNIADGNIINASDLDGEFDAVQAAFDAATGHTHDGTTGEGAPIEVTGPAQEYVSTNTELRPKANNTYDLGSASNQWKDLYVDGTANLDTVDIDAGNIDGTTIGAAAPAAGTFTTAAATTGNITTVNATTVDTTNIEVTNIKAKDGTAAGSIADSTGVVTIASSVLTTTDINGGTIDGATIATSDITVGTGKTLNVSSGTLTLANDQISGDKVEGGTINAITINTLGSTTGNITTVNATTVDSTNVEVTNIKAKDGTASATIADSTGVMTIASSVLTTADINGGTIDGTVIGGSTPAAISGTTGTFSGNLTVDTDTLFVDAASNNVGIGTSSPSGFLANKLVVATGGTANEGITIYSSSNNGSVWFADATTGNGRFAGGIDYQHATDELVFYTNSIGNVRIDSSGNVGIGTSSPVGRLTIKGAPNANALQQLAFEYHGSTSKFLSLGLQDATGNAQIMAGSGASLLFHTDSNLETTNERMRIDSSGNVGVGTTAPASGAGVARVIHIEGATAGFRAVGTSGSVALEMYTGSAAAFLDTTTNHPFVFRTNNVERARIDASGNLLVGATAYQGAGGSGAKGFYAGADGLLSSARVSASVAILNRTTSDGDIVEFRKDGSTVGSISTISGRLLVESGDTGLYFVNDTDTIVPSGNSAARDNAINLGDQFTRFKDLYLSGGVYLGGTGSANLLDDYEEGTWTPAGNGVTYTSVTGKYTKIGDFVFCSYSLTFPSTASGSVAEIQGLPFSITGDGARGTALVSETNCNVNPIMMALSGTKVVLRDASNVDRPNSAFSTFFINGMIIYRV